MDPFNGLMSNLDTCIVIGHFVGGDVTQTLKYLGIDVEKTQKEDSEYMYSEAEYKQVYDSICDVAFQIMLEIERAKRYNAKKFRKFSRVNYGADYMRLRRRMGINQTSLVLLKALYRDVKALSESYVHEEGNVKNAIKTITKLRMVARLHTPVVLCLNSEIRPSVLYAGLSEIILRNAAKNEKQYWYDECSDVLVLSWDKLIEMINDGKLKVGNFYLGLVGP